MKLVQINSIVIGERYKTNSHHSLRKGSRSRQTLKLQPHSSHLLTAFSLQCFNLKKKKKEKRKKRKRKKKERKRKKKPTHCYVPIHLSFKVIHYALITTFFNALGAPKQGCFQRGTLPCLCYLYAEPSEIFIPRL